MSKKIYKGYELIKAIAEGEIKENTNIKVHDLSVFDKIVTTINYSNKKLNWKTGEFDTSYLCNDSYYFELIEDETIDIESINELLVEQLKNREHTNADIYAIAEQQNKILQVLKQQEKRIKKLENKEYCQVCGVELTEENKYMKNMCYDCKYEEE